MKKRKIDVGDSEANCVMCNEQQEESISHLSFECKKAFEIWSEIYRWMKVSAVMHNNPSANLLQYSFKFGSRKESAFANAVWICVVWSIWKAHNEIVFCNSQLNCSSLVEEIKAREFGRVCRLKHRRLLSVLIVNG